MCATMFLDRLHAPYQYLKILSLYTTYRPQCKRSPAILADDIPSIIRAASAPPMRRVHGLPFIAPGILSPTPLALRDFPTSLSAVYLSEDELSMPYGLTKRETSRAVKHSIAAFIAWSTSDIQLDRDARYAGAVQSTTTEKHGVVIKSFLGYIVHIRGDTTPETVTLRAYCNPGAFIGFISFLKARSVGRGHILKHLSVARKVNAFLMTGWFMVTVIAMSVIVLIPCRSLLFLLYVLNTAACRAGNAVSNEDTTTGENMETWLERLERQLSSSLPRPAKGDLPSLRGLYKWVDELALGADEIYDQNLAELGCMTWNAAFQNQSALIVGLTVGRWVPPIRISILRSLLHPDSVGVGLGQGRNWRRCHDKDCRDPQRCVGNHFEVTEQIIGATEKQRITFVAPHHKNERRGFEGISFKLPEGPLTQMMLRHFSDGHRLLTQAAGTDVPNLFVSRPGGPFSAVTFCHFWKTLLRTAPDIDYFCPSLARTSFVDEYTNTSGLPVDMWDGAATVMGNTVKMWQKAYNPLKRGRDAQAAVDMHGDFTARLLSFE